MAWVCVIETGVLPHLHEQSCTIYHRPRVNVLGIFPSRRRGRPPQRWTACGILHYARWRPRPMVLGIHWWRGAPGARQRHSRGCTPLWLWSRCAPYVPMESNNLGISEPEVLGRLL